MKLDNTAQVALSNLLTGCVVAVTVLAVIYRAVPYFLL